MPHGMHDTHWVLCCLTQQALDDLIRLQKTTRNDLHSQQSREIISGTSHMEQATVSGDASRFPMLFDIVRYPRCSKLAFQILSKHAGGGRCVSRVQRLGLGLMGRFRARDNRHTWRKIRLKASHFGRASSDPGVLNLTEYTTEREKVAQPAHTQLQKRAEFVYMKCKCFGS